ncbi:MAG: hypothetical protein JRN19_06910 [Nitrososphaerota archaeon]|nr:hypothetical protein [Nitrososphaerota archaeon]MDG7049307.1 hypothetical protein [Nitrososphaerota archaeon]MDG7052159.1 hypothetical protein [Nitrososphaerota archaeon]
MIQRIFAAVLLVLMAISASSVLSMAVARSVTTPTSGVTGSQLQTTWNLYHENLSTSGPVPMGALPVPVAYNSTLQSIQSQGNQSNDVEPSFYDISSDYYVAAYGWFSTSGITYSTNYAVGTTVTFSGSTSNLGSDTVSGGLNVHVPDTTYNVDYIFEFYVYYNLGGYANIAFAIYATTPVTGGLYEGPIFGNVWYPEDYLITSGTISNVGNPGDHINLIIYYSTNIDGYPSNDGYVLDYMDPSNNPSDWTAAIVYTSGNLATMEGNGLTFGTLSTPFDIPYSAYEYQIGFSLSGIPQNSNWNVYDLNSWYQPSSASSSTYAQHTTTLTYTNGQGGPIYYSYIGDLWMLSQTPAQNWGIYIQGSGNSSSNEIYIGYNGGSQQGGVQLW